MKRNQPLYLNIEYSNIEDSISLDLETYLGGVNIPRRMRLLDFLRGGVIGEVYRHQKLKTIIIALIFADIVR